jgi:hypothetical protein
MTLAWCTTRLIGIRWQTRLFFTLDYLGHDDQAALLDGGLDQWTREKRPTSTLDNAAKPGSLTVHLHPKVLATMDYMKKLVGEPEDGAVICGCSSVEAISQWSLARLWIVLLGERTGQ